MFHPAQLALILVSMQFVFATEKYIEVFEFDKSDTNPKTHQSGNHIEGATLLGAIDAIDDEKQVRDLLEQMTTKGWHNWDQHTSPRGRCTFHRYEVYLYNPAEKKFGLNLKDEPSDRLRTIEDVFTKHPAVVVMPRNPWNY